MAFALAKAATVVLYRSAIVPKVSPDRTRYSAVFTLAADEDSVPTDFVSAMSTDSEFSCCTAERERKQVQEGKDLPLIREKYHVVCRIPYGRCPCHSVLSLMATC